MDICSDTLTSPSFLLTRSPHSPLLSRPDIYHRCFQQIFSEILVSNSIDCFKKCRRLSDETTKLSLLEMKQAWASSRFFTNNPINKRERKPNTSTHSVVVSLIPDRKEKFNIPLIFSFSFPARLSWKDLQKRPKKKCKNPLLLTLCHFNATLTYGRNP